MTPPHAGDRILPAAPVDRVLGPLTRFLHVQSASGIVLVVCTVAALVIANSPWREAYFRLLHLPCTLGVGSWVLTKDLLHVINDGLMTVFFFVVGLEIKRELVAGELRGWKKAALPVFAALGGMVVPALLFLAIAHVGGFDPALQRGWAIPMATDIAFVVGILALLGKRIAPGLQIMLLSLAIVDDIGAVLVIALVYTDAIQMAALAIAGAGCVLTVLMNLAGVRAVAAYAVVGVIVWLAVLKSGVHPTVAGVLLGLMTPAAPWISTARLQVIFEKVAEDARDEALPQALTQATLAEASVAAREAISPLHRLESLLHPWVAFGIMPVFALANAGVEVKVAEIGQPLSLAVAAGLALGKPVGIVLFSAVAVALGLASLPRGVTRRALIGGGCLGGIGFTMSLFLTGLALPAEHVASGKIGTLTGSLISVIAGSLVLMTLKPDASLAE
jgi:NhaA family Na+:H+ antiporter